MQNKKLNGWEIVTDNQEESPFNDMMDKDDFVVKRKFTNHNGPDMGLSLYAKKRYRDTYELEIAIEKYLGENKATVMATLRLNNTASEKEALKTVSKITESI